MEKFIHKFKTVEHTLNHFGQQFEIKTKKFEQKFDVFLNLRFKTKYVEVLQNLKYFGKFKSLNILTEYLKFKDFGCKFKTNFSTYTM